MRPRLGYWQQCENYVNTNGNGNVNVNEICWQAFDKATLSKGNVWRVLTTRRSPTTSEEPQLTRLKWVQCHACEEQHQQLHKHCWERNKQRHKLNDNETLEMSVTFARVWGRFYGPPFTIAASIYGTKDARFLPYCHEVDSPENFHSTCY